MRTGPMLFELLPWLVLLAACSSGSVRTDPLDLASEAYTRLVLAVGRHDSNYVDAFYGPPEWKVEADRGQPIGVPELLRRTHELLATVHSASRSDRRDYLEKQLLAVEGFLRRLGGEHMTLSEEARVLYDFDPPVHPREEFERAVARLDSLLPGDGELQVRIKEFRDRFVIPPDRVAAVVDACLELTRERTRKLVALPSGETFQVAFVRGKPWGAYNWYKGGFESLIEINTDLPTELGRIFHTISHEGYPGHHVNAVLMEADLVRRNGWREFTVYPLYSPQSFLAEGTANVGLSILLTEREQIDFLRDVLAPLAGLKGLDFERYASVLDALRPLDYAKGEAARLQLDEGRSEEEVLAFLMRYGLLDRDRARKAIDFAQTYRSYVFNYTEGENLVRAYVGNGPDRAEKYFDLLRKPVTPSQLVAATRSRS